MDRRSFIRSSCYTCAGSIGLFTILEACTSQKYISNYVLNKNTITVRKTEFTVVNKKAPTQLPFVLLKPEQFPFPIALYKDGDSHYTALFMQCTHQGCELNPHERMVVCPCHGAEFNTKGEVTQGPAEINLKSFITSHDHENIYIQLI
jgi:cytochrome b6-f complex iron-sulfur subunit